MGLLRWTKRVMQLAKLKFTARALTRVRFPDFAGGALRGALGYALRRVACMVGRGDCGACDCRGECAYSVLLESPIPQGAAMMRLYPAAPHPFVIESQGLGAGAFEPGDLFEFGVVLVGWARSFLPALVAAVCDAGGAGIGIGRGRFALADVTAFDGLGQETSIYSSARGELSADVPAIELGFAPDPEAPRAFDMELVTPVRIKHGGRLCDSPGFHVLFRSLLRRIVALEHFYGIPPDSVQPRVVQPSHGERAALIAEAQKVQTVRSDLRWVDCKRYSSRQRRPMRLGGVLGRLRFSAVTPGLWPYLRAGERVHLGKAATFGLGQYVLGVDSRARRPEACAHAVGRG